MQQSDPIFVSYSRADTAFARQLQQRLSALGFELWRDRSHMQGGRDWWQQIQTAIEGCHTLVLCMSPAALQSPIVTKEWRYARTLGRRVIPIIAAPVDFKAVPRWMAQVDWVNLDAEPDLAWSKFVEQLKQPYEPVRVPFTVPDLPDNYVDRPHEYTAILQQLLDESRQNPVAITTAVQGGGGFGKTVLAQAVCFDADLQHAFDDGILWITLGQTPDIVTLIENQIRLLTGRGSGLSDINAIAARLGEILADRDVLLVLDDVWDERHARPFIGKGRAQLITTRQQAVISTASAVDVNAMTSDQALKLLIGPLAAPPADPGPFAQLARRFDGWALALKLAGAWIKKTVEIGGKTPQQALAGIEGRLQKKGIGFLDRDNPTDRERAISANLELSLEQLDAWQQRFRELAIFPEDTDIPVAAIERLWHTTAGMDAFDTEDALRKMHELSLFTHYAQGGAAVQLHDVVRSYLRARIDIEALNQRFLDAYAVEVWADMDEDEPYLWAQLFYHLREAGRLKAMVQTALDLRYLAMKTLLRGAHAAEADLKATVSAYPKVFGERRYNYQPQGGHHSPLRSTPCMVKG